MRTREGNLVVLAALACGDSDAVVVSSACDADGPTTILRLDPDEVVARVWSLGDEHALFRSAPAASDAADGSRLRVATTCGEAVRELGGGLEVLDVDDEILACAPAEGTILLLSPTGAAPARTLATAVACGVAPLEDGLVAVGGGESGFGPLWWIDREGSGPRQLHPRVRAPVGWAIAAEPLAASDGHVLALTDGAEIVDVDLGEDSVTVVRTGVFDFRASSDLRFVVWQGAPADGPAGESVLSFVDRELDGGMDRGLFAARLSWSWSPFATGYLVLRHEAWGDDRAFSLPDLGIVALPPEITVRGVTEAGQIAYAFGTGDWHDVDMWRWDPHDQSHVQLIDGAAMFRFAKDGLEVFVPSAEVGLQRGDVELRAWTDASARLLARDVPSQYTRRDDDWIAAVHDDDGDGRGTLRLHREDTAIDVDDDARVGDAGLDRGRVFGDDVVFTGDDDGPALLRISVPR